MGKLKTWMVDGCRIDSITVCRRWLFKVLAVVALGVGAISARADGWTSDFTITSLYVAQQNNFQYRVYGMPPVASCTNATTWAYVNDADAGSPGSVAAILSAYSMGKLIRLNITTVNGFCHIVELLVSG
jgi:hypothetical protein